MLAGADRIPETIRCIIPGCGLCGQGLLTSTHTQQVSEPDVLVVSVPNVNSVHIYYTKLAMIL
jgi:hypothetical protein